MENKSVNILEDINPSPIDQRDFSINKLILNKKIPDEYFSDYYYHVFDQGVTSQCVSCSIANLVSLTQNKDKKIQSTFAPNYLYANRDGDFSLTKGLFPRKSLSVLQKYGIPRYAEMPGILNYQNAYNLYIKNKDKYDNYAAPLKNYYYYYKLNNIDEIKTAVYNLGGAICMLPVYNKLELEKIDIIKLPSTNLISSYHEVVILGWNKNGFIILNSWGEKWGIQGLALLPYLYPIKEAWSITRLKPINFFIRLYYFIKSILTFK